MKLSVAKIFAKWGWPLLALTYASTFIVILILAYTGNIPEFIQKIPSYDKIGHVVLYSLATYLGHRVLKRLKVKGFGWALPLWPLLFALFTLAEELVQLTSPQRTFSWLDAIASFLGILLGYWLAEKS